MKNAFDSFNLKSQNSLNPTALVESCQDTEKGYAKGPERTLLTALLFDGINAYLNYLSANTKQAASKYREAYRWVHTYGDDDYLFSFESVCSALGINPDYLRCGLINAANSQTFEWKKTRRTF
ncbi:MAG: hypothetical protein D6780_07180 [Candidatus Dadabacteria bacterium]|nr:MAG: hypothetical protein D6780_07180 [Candidatus Dadabacteria bacterium]